MYVLFAFIHSVSYSVSVYRGVQTARNGFIISALGFSVLLSKRVPFGTCISTHLYKDRYPPYPYIGSSRIFLTLA